MSISQELLPPEFAARRAWLDELAIHHSRGHPSLQLSAHGLLLQTDIERAFSAGAWASVIVLAQAVIESTVRDIQTQDYESKAKSIFAGDAELDRIRSIRNELVHPQEPGTPSLLWVVPNGDYAACQEALEVPARKACELMYRTIFAQGVA